MVILLAMLTAFIPLNNTNAISVYNACTGENANSSVCKSSGDDLKKTIGSIVNVLLWFVGVLSVIMLIVGGLKYVLSAGDPKGVAAAKSTIIYAIIGLVVAVLAYAIVKFVIGII